VLENKIEKIHICPFKIKEGDILLNKKENKLYKVMKIYQQFNKKRTAKIMESVYVATETSSTRVTIPLYWVDDWNDYTSPKELRKQKIDKLNGL